MEQKLKHSKEASPFTKNPLKIAAASLFLGLGCTAMASASGLAPVSDKLLRNAAEQDQIRFSLSLPLNNQAELKSLLEKLYDPSSPQFHQWLKSADFDARFGPTQAQYDGLKSLAQQYGLKITGEHASHTLLDVEASAATIRSVFGSQMEFRQTPEGKVYHAAASEAVEPFPIAAMGAHAIGLTARPLHPRYIKSNHKVTKAEVDAAAQPNAGTSPNGLYGPADLKTAYNLNGIQNGGLPVAVIEFSGANYGDAATYAKQFGLNSPKLIQKAVGSNPGTTTSAAVEVMLDIEMVEAIANPTSIYVYTGTFGATTTPDTYQQIADDNLVVAVGSSWGECEYSTGQTQAEAEDTAFTKMVAEGISLFSASGDTGAEGCLRNGDGSSRLNTGDPDSPNVVSVGGTSLTTTSAQAWSSEVVWDTSSSEGGGGGISQFWTIPSYQKNVVFNGPSGQFSTTMRNVPDVALDADPNTGVYVYSSVGNQGWIGVGGTSDAAPQFAAFWGLVSKGLGKAAGFANPPLYSLAENATSYAKDFHDITSGNNNYYNAYTGFDDATGWGSYNGGNLYADLISTLGSGSSSSSSSGGGSSSSSSSSSSGSSSSSSSSSSSGGSSSSSSSSSGSSSSSSSSSSGGSSGGSSSGGAGVPPAPAGLTATGTSYDFLGAVQLSWKASSGATRYYVYQGTSPGGESSTALGYVTGTSAEVTNLYPFSTYYYTVKAYDAAGYSASSNEASATTGW